MEAKNMVAVITGASHGLGKEMAFRFAAEGMAVVLAARDESLLRESVGEIRRHGGRASYIRTDISKSDDVRAMIGHAVKEFGGIDALINNAAVTWFGRSFDDPGEDVDALFRLIVETNIVGTWTCTRCALPFLKKNGGSILNIASVHGHAGVPKSSAYAMSKGGMLALTKALAVELAPFNIRVNSISLGWIRVNLGGEVRAAYGEEVAREYLERFGDYEDDLLLLNQPLRRIGAPEDMSELALLLISDKGRFITGEDFAVDGGVLAMLAEPFRFDINELWRVHKRGEEAKAWLSGFKKLKEE